MANAASVLKDEIARVARKEIRREQQRLRRLRRLTSEIAALKRRVLELERQLRQLGRAGQAASKPTAANEESVSPGTRFSAKSMAAQRRRLGLSAAECGLLIGASSQSIYNWEEGKARPRAQHLRAEEFGATASERDPRILESRKAA
jgi:DNA-binding transcriptional regulator YiaG